METEFVVFFTKDVGNNTKNFIDYDLFHLWKTQIQLFILFNIEIEKLLSKNAIFRSFHIFVAKRKTKITTRYVGRQKKLQTDHYSFVA